MDKKNAIRSETILNQNTVKVYTDGSKLDGKSMCGVFMQNTQTTSRNKHFPPWNTQHCAPGRSLNYFRSSKELAFGKNAQSIVALVDSQAAIKAIKALIKCTVTCNHSVQLH